MTLFFDLETQKLAHEVGGWGNIEALGLAVAASYDDDHGYRDWWEAQAGDLLEELDKADLVVGYNVTKFDYRVLSLYGSTAGFDAKTFDILDEIVAQRGRRVSLASLAVINLGEAKGLESGVMAVSLWKTGEMEKLIAYCRKDVELTKRLYAMWEDQGLLWVPGGDYVVWPGVNAGAQRSKDAEGEGEEQ